jgi:aryl-alcohol dehydrogenase-like predicted oxidoreductase
VQNQYNLVQREDGALVDSLARQNIAYVPFFPLGEVCAHPHEVPPRRKQVIAAAICERMICAAS